MRIQEVDLNHRDDITFRFRSIKNLLDYRELEDLYLYFCPYSEEDDVLEGSANLYWQADEILWRNFYAHYFRVVFFSYSWMLIASDDDEREKIIRDGIVWKLFRKDFSIETMISDFWEHNVTAFILQAVMARNHKVRYEELKLYFHILHIVALAIIKKHFSTSAHTTVSSSSIDPIDLVKADLNKFLENIQWDKMNEDGVFRALDREWCRHFRDITENDEQQPLWRKWLLLDFPDEYVKILKIVAFPNWYLTSFCGNCTDVRNWAQYGDSHKGICLIFRTHDCSSGKGIRLNICHQWSSVDGNIFKPNIERLCKVIISESSPELNFFSYLGNIPGGILEEWCRDSDGNHSQYYIDPKNRAAWEEWHRNYWQTFHQIALRKGTSWDRLDEERIILTDGVIMDYQNKENRKINYDFMELEGIIWGCRTDEKKKNEIRGIIRNLCNKYNRTDFKFFQAVEELGTLEIWIEKDE